MDEYVKGEDEMTDELFEEMLAFLERYSNRAIIDCGENTILKKVTGAMIMVEAVDVAELVRRYKTLAPTGAHKREGRT